MEQAPRDLREQLLDRLRHAVMYENETRKALLEALRLLEERKEEGK
jgi:hypothetical protein